MKISLTGQGLLDPAQLRSWRADVQKAIHLAVKDGMKAGSGFITKDAREQLAASFTVKRKGFVASMKAKVLDQDATRFPALLVGSKIPWLGMHMTGGAIAGRMLIPLLPNRIGPKKFKAIVTQLMRSGNAFFIQKNGQVILMAENISENGTALSRFKRAERQRTGSKIKKGQEIPIAVLVKTVALKKRFDLTKAVTANVPRLASEIQTRLRQI